MPVSGGTLKTLHWSISEIKGSAGFQPRVADTRVGFFTTGYRDLGKYESDSSVVRYINRWHLEPAVPSLELSPPKKPIVFIIEHTTPLRYRRFVRDGILYWNKAFEKVGIVDAIEVYYQDKATGAHMDKDPEDVRYNFIRWLNNDVATAIGPSRIDPTTGEILGRRHRVDGRLDPRVPRPVRQAAPGDRDGGLQSCSTRVARRAPALGPASADGEAARAHGDPARPREERRQAASRSPGREPAIERAARRRRVRRSRGTGEPAQRLVPRLAR